MTPGSMYHVLAAKKTSSTKNSSPESPASQSNQLASGPTDHHRRLRHVFGLPAGGPVVSEAPRPDATPATLSRPPKTGIRRSFASSHLSPPDQSPKSSHPADQPRLTAPAFGPPAPPESSYSRPPASLPRPPGHRSSKTFLGFISTPLIWQGRKRPNGGRRPTSTRASPRPPFHITKPAASLGELKSTSRPTYARQPTGFRYTPMYTKSPVLQNTTGCQNASTQPTSQANPLHYPGSNKESPTTTPDSKLSPAAGVQGSYPWQRRDEALHTKESSSVVGASPLSLSASSLLSPSSALSYRKNKPAAPQWSLLNMNSGENQTMVKGNWTDPLETLGDEDLSGNDESFVYDLTPFGEEGASLSLYEFDAAYSLDKPTTISPAFTSPDTNNQQSFNQFEPHTLLPTPHPLSASEGRSEHLLMETHFPMSLDSRLVADSSSPTYSIHRLNPEAVPFISRSHTATVAVSQTLTGAQTHHRVSNNTSSSGQRLEENPNSQAATQQLQTLTFHPTPDLFIPPLSSLSSLLIQPTPSLPMIRLSSSAYHAEESLPKQIFSSSVPQKEDISQISESSLSLHPLESMDEADIAGSDVKLAVAKSRLLSNLYSTDLNSSVHFILHTPPISPSVFPKNVSSTFTSSLNIHNSSTPTALPLSPQNPSFAFLAASNPLTSSHAFNLSGSLFVSSSPVTLQIPTPPSLHTNTLPPLLASPQTWSTTIPLPPFALQQPSPSPQSKHMLSETDGIVEPGRVPESDGVDKNFQPSLLSFLSLSSNLQRDLVVTGVETASLLSLPLFSKAPSDSQMPVVEGAVLSEYNLFSAERSTNNIAEPVKSQLPYSVNNQFLDAQSGIFVEPVEIVIDPSFNQINATPSGLSMEKLSSSSVTNTPSSPPEMSLSQLELHVPDLDLSLALWPSSNAASLSVSQFLADQRYLSNIYTPSHVSYPVSQSDIGFTSLPAAGIWPFERTPALLQATIDRSQDLHSASLSATSSNPFLSSWSPLVHHRDSVSFTVSSETLPGDAMMRVADVTELTEEEKSTPSSMSLSQDAVIENSLLLAGTFSSGSQDRHTSSLTFNTVPWRFQETISHFHTDNQVNTAAGAEPNSVDSQALPGYDHAFNHPTPPLSNPSVMAPTQTLALHNSPSAQLGITTPQHAPGLDYTHHSALTQTNTEEHRHTHSSTQMLSHSAFRPYMSEFLDAREELEMREMPGQEAQYAEAHVNAGGRQQQQSHLTSALTSPPISSSIVSSLSLAASLTPPFLHLSPIYPTILPSITLSLLPHSSLITPSITPVLSSWVASQTAVAASMAQAKTGSLSPTRPTAGFNHSTTTQPALDNRQSFQRLTTYPISQSTQSMQQFIAVSQLFPLHQASSLHDDKLKSSHSQLLLPAEVYDNDELLSQLANKSETVNDSGFVTVPVLSPETSSNLTSAADFLPKIQLGNEHDFDAGQASSAVNTNDNVTLDVMLNTASSLQTNQKAVLNTQIFLIEMKTVSTPPTTAESAQPTGGPVILNPLHSSGLNIPSSAPVSRSTGSSIDALDHGIVSGLAELSPTEIDSHNTNTAGLKYIAKSNVTTVPTLKDPPAVPGQMTDTIKAKNATTLRQNGSMEVSQGNVKDNKPTADLSISDASLNSSLSVLNHSWNQSSGVNGAMNPDHSDVKVVHLATTQPVIGDAHHFITTKHSSPAAPFKAVSASASSGGSGGLKKATVRATPGSPTVDLTSRPALPCQCKQRFHFTCLCGLSSGNSMSCSTKTVDVENIEQSSASACM